MNGIWISYVFNGAMTTVAIWLYAKFRRKSFPKNLDEVMDIPDDIAKNIGIRMVYTIAREINYQHLLGLNTLTIHI